MPGVPVAAAGAPGSIYAIPAGASGVVAQYQAGAAYAAGQVVVAYNDGSLIEAALGATGEAPWTAQGVSLKINFRPLP